MHLLASAVRVSQHEVEMFSDVLQIEMSRREMVTANPGGMCGRKKSMGEGSLARRTVLRGTIVISFSATSINKRWEWDGGWGKVKSLCSESHRMKIISNDKFMFHTAAALLPEQGR